MKLYVSKNHFIHTVYGYIPLKDLVNNDDPKLLVKSVVFSIFSSKEPKSWIGINRMEYGHVNVKHVGRRKLKGLRVFSQCLLVEPISDVYLLIYPKLEYMELKYPITTKLHSVTFVKHAIVDVEIDKSCYSNNVDVVELEVIDLPSITLSADEVGTETLTLFNGKIVAEGGAII
jgi:hypothetical protein